MVSGVISVVCPSGRWWKSVNFHIDLSLLIWVLTLLITNAPLPPKSFPLPLSPYPLFCFSPHTPSGFCFLVYYAATQVAIQLQQERIQVGRSNREVRKHPTESNGTPAMDLVFVFLVFCFVLFVFVFVCVCLYVCVCAGDRIGFKCNQRGSADLLIRIVFCHRDVAKNLPLHCLLYVTVNIYFCFYFNIAREVVTVLLILLIFLTLLTHFHTHIQRETHTSTCMIST